MLLCKCFFISLLVFIVLDVLLAFQSSPVHQPIGRIRRRARRLTMRQHDDDMEGDDGIAKEVTKISRSDFLREITAAAAASGTAMLGLSTAAQAARPPSKIIPPPPPSGRPFLWQVLMTDPPQLQPYTTDGEAAILKDLTRTCNAIFLGEHPDSTQDHALQAQIINSLKKYKPRDAGMAIGIEMVQQKFQSALDDYIKKVQPDDALADQALRKDTEWDARWAWPFDLYLPILHMARENGFRLLALGVESEAMSKVREVGLEGLTQQERGLYVADPSGFIQSVKNPSFKLYAERFIMPSYAARAEAAMLGANPPSPAKFLAARILWDESMATQVVRHLQTNSRDLVVMLVSGDHIKFGMGAPVRLERLLQSARVKLPPGRGLVKSILLNPTPEDTGSQTRRLRLTLGYAANLEKCRPVSDYLWYSTYPKVAWLEHPQNPLSLPYKDEDTLFQVFSSRR